MIFLCTRAGKLPADIAVVTINGEEIGKQILFKNFEPAPEVITMATDVILEPDTARYIVHEAQVSSGTPTNKLYTTSYIWKFLCNYSPPGIKKTALRNHRINGLVILTGKQDTPAPCRAWTKKKSRHYQSIIKRGQPDRTHIL